MANTEVAVVKDGTGTTTPPAAAAATATTVVLAVEQKSGFGYQKMSVEEVAEITERLHTTEIKVSFFTGHGLDSGRNCK